MAMKTQRNAQKRNRRTETPTFRFMRVRQTDQSWLLTNTAIVAGAIGLAVIGAPSLALAAPICTGPVDYLGVAQYNCNDPAATLPESISVSDTYALHIDGTDTTPYNLLVNDIGPAFEVDGNGEDGTINVSYGASIENNGGDGFLLEDAGNTTININDLIRGGTEDGDGFVVDGASGDIRFNIGDDGVVVGGDGYGIITNATGNVEIHNNGHVEGQNAAAVSINDADGARVNNHSYASMIGATNGVEFLNMAGPAVYAGGDGLVFGMNGAGLYFSDITNSTGDDTVQVYSNHSGIVMGSEDGVRIEGSIQGSTQGNAVNIDNGVYFDVGYTDENDTSTAFLRRNEGGLIWGMGGAGVMIDAFFDPITGDININNQGTLDSWIDMDSEDAPDIDPAAGFPLFLLSSAAVDFAGHEDGLDIPRGIIGDWAGIGIGYTEGDIHINNGGSYRNGIAIDDRGTEDTSDDVEVAIVDEWVGGGQIIGIEGFGISLYDIDGNVDIYNGNDDDATQRGGVIVGMAEDGVAATYISGEFNQNNDGGVTYGAFNGINLHNILGVEGDDNNEDGNPDWLQAAHVNNIGGTIWGNDADGFHLWNANGDVNIWGPEGTIYGYDDGVRVGNVYGGGFYMNNAGGWVQGYTGDGIQVSGVESEDFGGEDGPIGGWAWVDNGDFDGMSEDWGGNGGLIIGAETAVSLHAESAGLNNGRGGMVIGAGSWTNPVVELYTDSGGDNGRTAHVNNYGLMTSDNFPGLHTSVITPDGDDLTTPLAEGALQTLLTEPITEAEYAALLTEADEAYEYVWSAGQSGTALPDFDDFADAANDLLIKSRGGALELFNQGVMIGRINSDGTNYDEEMNLKGAQIVNFGTWFTTDNGQWGNEIHGSSQDWVMNGGWIQTALDGTTGEFTSFDGVNEFHNGGVLENFFGTDNDLTLEYGLLSMLDGGVGDETYITHDFFGSARDDGTHSTLAMDVSFTYDPMIDRSDYLEVEDEIIDFTSVIFNRVSPEASTTVLGDRIYFATSEYRNTFDGDNAFVIDPNSDNYIEVGGIGAIQDGLYAWYEGEEGGILDPYGYYLESSFAPQAAQLPSLITGAQNIWHDTAGQVADHVYGNHFPLAGNGGGGADVPVGEVPFEEASAPGAAVWAKATGSWTDRNTEVIQDIPPVGPVAIDTSFVQNTFSILGGADFQPMGGGDDGLRVGVFGGYVMSSLDFDSYGASAEYSGGIIGAYAAFTSGGFYADAEVKADVLEVTYSAPISPGFETTGASTSIGLLANTGYRMELGDSAFFEPIASLSFVSTQIDGFDAGGASVAFSNGESLQGGAGARVGMTLGTPGDTTTEVSVLGKVWNEFEEANVVTITDGLGNSATFSDGISGVFGEISGTATIYSADKSFSAFGSTGVKFNEDFTTVDAKVGLRKGF